MAATRVYSTAAYFVAAFVAILFGLCPKFGALVGSIPGGVLGGVTVVLYGMIGLLGAKIWVRTGSTSATRSTWSRRPRASSSASATSRWSSPTTSPSAASRSAPSSRSSPTTCSGGSDPEDEATDVVTPTSAHHDEHDHAHGHDQTHKHRAGGTQDSRLTTAQDSRAGAECSPPARRCARMRRVKPSPFAYVGARRRSTRRSRCSPRSAATARCSPAARACCRCSTCGWPRRRTWSTSTGCPSWPRSASRTARWSGRCAGPARRPSSATQAAHGDAAAAAPGAAAVAHPAIRNRGTTVGSIAHADPSGEMTAVLALTGGTVELAQRAGRVARSAADDFFVGPLESASRPGELAVSALFPALPGAHRDDVRRGRPPPRRLRGLRRGGGRSRWTTTCVTVGARGVRLGGPDTAGARPHRRRGRRRPDSGRLGRGRRPRAGAGRPGGRHPRHRRLPAAPGRGADRRGRCAEAAASGSVSRRWRVTERALHDVPLTVNGVPRDARCRPAGCCPTSCATTCG